MMKAIKYTKYGSPDMLQLEEVNRPVPNDNEVLIKVYATSLNSWDLDLLRGKPFIVRLAGGGLLKPKKKILGCDVAGRIELIGKNIKKFQPGDEVFGDLSQCGWGGLAEYVCASENALALKPDGMTFEQAAAIPQAGVMALQSLQDKKQIQVGQSVLINGGGGGVGTFVIQMAKSFGADVTAVDSNMKLELMRSLGADHVFDYKKEDFSKNGKQYNFIIDVVANRSTFQYRRSLKTNGIFVMIGGTTSTIFQTMLLGPLISLFGSKKLGVLMHQPNKNINQINKLFETGKIKPVIGGCYPLHKTAEAFNNLGDGLVKGKVVISIAHDNISKSNQ